MTGLSQTRREDAVADLGVRLELPAREERDLVSAATGL